MSDPTPVNKEELLEEQPKESASGYSKKSPFMWIVIYALIGLFVYGVIYYFAFYKKGGSSSFSPQVQNSEPTSAATDQAEEEVGVTEKSENITLTKEGFSPKSVTIKTGTEIIWINQSGKVATVDSSPHPAHTDYSPLNLGNFADGGSVSLIFDTPGTYKFHNHLNPSDNGTIIVN